jgi:hypothetical protein
MRLRTIAFAASMLLGSGAGTASFAQSSTGSQHASGWIFITILGIPFVLALLGVLTPGLLDSFVRPWPWEQRTKG